MATGRTVTKWMRFGIDDSGGTPREIPVDSVGPVGFTFDEVDVTAYQDAVKNYLSGHPDSPIEISGPLDNTVPVGLAASGAAPTLSGSFSVLSLITTPTFTTPLSLWVAWGIRGYWATGDPAWGCQSGYVCTKFTVEGDKYSASFKPYPGVTPSWLNAIIT